MTEKDIAAQLEASMSAVHGAFARVKQAVADNDALSALEGMADAIPALAGFAGAATQAVEVVRQQRDAARADVAKLQAEVAKLRAWMPKWRKNRCLDDEWTLRPRAALAVSRGSDGLWYWSGMRDDDNPAQTRVDAMRAAEAAAGLPQCEVCDE